VSRARLAWRREVRERGLASIVRAAHSQYGYDLRLGTDVLARVREFAGPRCWYWYGMGMNTLSRNEGPRVFGTAHEAKMDAQDFARAYLRRAPNGATNA
jgi:hypothetical protein